MLYFDRNFINRIGQLSSVTVKKGRFKHFRGNASTSGAIIGCQDKEPIRPPMRGPKLCPLGHRRTQDFTVEGFTRWGAGPGDLGTEVPQWVQGQSEVRHMQKLKQM